MNFKDAAKADLSAFFDPDEFAGRNNGHPHTWDGVPVNAVLDSNSQQAIGSVEYQTFPSATLVVQIPTGEIAKPGTGSAHRFDGALYTVGDIMEEMGVYVITLIAGSAG